jgi:hypothetical protein
MMNCLNFLIYTVLEMIESLVQSINCLKNLNVITLQLLKAQPNHFINFVLASMVKLFLMNEEKLLWGLVLLR